MWPIVAVVAAGAGQPAHIQDVDIRDVIFFRYSLAECESNRDWAIEHCRHINYLRCVTDAPAWLRDWETDAVRRKEAWEYLYNAKRWSTWYSLDRLRCAIGVEAYYTGRMPCPVPVEWFPEPP